jgi:hypothetical protein
MNHIGEWETLLDTAFREINEEIMYWNSETQQCCTLDKHHLEKYIAYLECALKVEEANSSRQQSDRCEK